MEYNYGRAFHGLGIAHLAAKHYELVLAGVQKRMDEAAAIEPDEMDSENSEEIETPQVSFHFSLT